MRRTANREKGFTLLETVVVIGIMFVMMGLAIISSFGSMENAQANSALAVVSGQMRLARELAITQRRNVQIFIVANPPAGSPAHVDYQLLPAPGSKENPGPVVQALLPTHAAFMLTPGVPDTPMKFGNSAAVYVGGANGGPPVMQFTSVGQFTDGSGFTTLNGTLFIGIPGQLNTARAVTIMGGTGRVRPYSYAGNNNWNE